MKWGPAEKKKWFNEQKIQRSYRDDVVTKIDRLAKSFEVVNYGALSLNPEDYPLFLLKSDSFDSKKKTVLVTGGVHGYETSGVHGALAFLERAAHDYAARFNIVCAPCLSPWSYETVNRWNPETVDPNRSFKDESPAEECRLFLAAMSGIRPDVHIDLHETTDTDNTIFRPALAARDGVPEKDEGEIPDGFYLVGDSENPQPGFQRAIIEAVRRVTHIAPPDDEGKLIGQKIEQEGVVNYPVKSLFLCAGFSKAAYVTTTEVYPDSPRVNPANCVDAQVAAIRGGLDYLLLQDNDRVA